MITLQKITDLEKVEAFEKECCEQMGHSFILENEQEGFNGEGWYIGKEKAGVYAYYLYQDYGKIRVGASVDSFSTQKIIEHV